jgi:hypothetical protein
MSWTHRAALAAVVAATLSAPTISHADIKNYEFVLVSPEVKKSDRAEIDVRLIDKRSGKGVSDAVIFASRLDMAPDGMPTMAAPLEAAPSKEPGTYRFKADLPMAGNWRLSLGAKVQGEEETLEGQLVVKALP